MAVSAKMAFAAIGEARSRKPGMMAKTAVNQIARKGVLVELAI
jgi:hypothetical protein